MTDEKFEKASCIKARLSETTKILNLLKGGCDMTFKSGDDVVEVTDNEVREKIMEIYSSRADELQREFGWL